MPTGRCACIHCDVPSLEEKFNMCSNWQVNDVSWAAESETSGYCRMACCLIVITSECISIVGF